jgi:hypothetical protein
MVLSLLSVYGGTALAGCAVKSYVMPISCGETLGLAFFPSAGALCGFVIPKSTSPRGKFVLDQKTLDSLTPSERVSHALRQFALIVDPAEGKLTALADELNVHPATLSAWIANGHVPEFQIPKLKKSFGHLVRKLLPLENC